MLCDSPMRCRNRPDMTKSILWNVKQNIKHISNHCNFNVMKDITGGQYTELYNKNIR